MTIGITDMQGNTFHYKVNTCTYYAVSIESLPAGQYYLCVYQGSNHVIGMFNVNYFSNLIKISNFMKKYFLFFMTALTMSVFAFANNNANSNLPNVEKSTIDKAVNAYIELYKVTVQANEITLPFVITVPAPQETVIGVSGPVNPNNTNWNVSNGYLTITYTRETDIMDIRNGGTFCIEVATSPMPQQGTNYGYAITLVVE